MSRCFEKALFKSITIFAFLCAAPLFANSSIQNFLEQHCILCHGNTGRDPGAVDLSRIRNNKSLVADPELLQQMVDVLSDRTMPPTDASDLAVGDRDVFVNLLRSLRVPGLAGASERLTPVVRRMTRFQYNNAVKDLLQLNVEVFTLPERMMREYRNYYQPATGKMPDSVRVGSRPLGKSQLIEPRLGGVGAYPQDLRAEHGYDTQADHLTMSPLLLESFMQLGMSIVDSPDFHEATVGVWQELFAAPPDVNTSALEELIQNRLQHFLTRAFRTTIDKATLQRYVAFGMGQLERDGNFVEAMKSVVAATIASPQFFYLGQHVNRGDKRVKTRFSDDDFALASNLSFFLWGSIPDGELLNLAAAGELHRQEVLSTQVNRMLDSKLTKRFCDSFPAQWLQLEQIVSATPDKTLFPEYYFLKYNAGMNLMAEPLLLFETVLVENLSILQFIDSDFSYRSPMLTTWYDAATPVAFHGPGELVFKRVPIVDRRQGGIFTNAAIMTMTSRSDQTQPITRGAWVATVILNDPPEPPPADIPLLNNVKDPANELSIKEKFAAHQDNASCASCHRKIDPLGFVLENYNPIGFWRDQYSDGKPVEASGVLLGQHVFSNVVEFKDALLLEKDRFTAALAKHLLTYALGRRLDYRDVLAIEGIVRRTAQSEYRLRALLREVVLSEAFSGTNRKLVTK
jgi:hypothetical protein